MNDWKKYAQSKATSNELSGGKVSVVEYAIIKVVDNWLILFLTFITSLFAGVGLLAHWKNLQGADWFFDAAKVIMGVLLGVLTQKGKGG